GEQQLSLLHDLPVGEVNADDLTRNARPYLDAAAGFEPADIIVPLVDLTLQRSSDRYHRWWRCGGGRRIAAPPIGAGGEQQQRAADDRRALPQRTLSKFSTQGDGVAVDPRQGRDHVH